jgi:hypothetical protein
MNKTLALVVWPLLFTAPLYSQGTRDDLLKQLAQEACQEIKKTDFSNKSADELKLALGLPLVMVSGRHQGELKAVGIDMSDSQSARKFGNDVGIYLAQNCPEFVASMMKNPSAVAEIAQNAKTSGPLSISGTLVKIVNGDFSYLQVEDSKGKIEKLWWMEYFDGSNVLVVSPQNRLNRPIKVNYVEKELFNFTLKDYVKVKVITGID